jgi:hypothetical protein
MCADISDVTALLATMATAAVYPNGTSAPSVTGNPITIFEGWPLQQSLDAAIAAGQSQVSIFPKLGGAPGSVFQILNEDYVVTPPVHGLTIASVSEGVVTVMGSPSPGEYLTIIADGRNVFSQTGPDLPTILNLIAAQAAPIYGDLPVFQTSGSGPQLLLMQATGGGIEFPTTNIKARLGAPATKGRATHRQRPTIMISVWSPNNADRNTIAIAVDVALKQVNRLTFPDTSEGQLFAAGFAQIDALEPSSVFRRDLFFTCEYATLELFQVFEVTSFNLTIGSIVGGGEVDQTFVD